jgi:hypothetical protein
MAPLPNCCPPMAWRPPTRHTASPSRAARRSACWMSGSDCGRTTSRTRVGLSRVCTSFSTTPEASRPSSRPSRSTPIPGGGYRSRPGPSTTRRARAAARRGCESVPFARARPQERRGARRARRRYPRPGIPGPAAPMGGPGLAGVEADAVRGRGTAGQRPRPRKKGKLPPAAGRRRRPPRTHKKRALPLSRPTRRVPAQVYAKRGPHAPWPASHRGRVRAETRGDSGKAEVIRCQRPGGA